MASEARLLVILLLQKIGCISLTDVVIVIIRFMSSKDLRKLRRYKSKVVSYIEQDPDQFSDSGDYLDDEEELEEAVAPKELHPEDAE